MLKRLFKKLVVAVTGMVIFSTLPTFAGNLTCRCHDQYTEGTYADYGSGYHTITILVAYHYKVLGGAVYDITESNLTHENNTVIYSATKPYTGEKIAHYGNAVGYIDNELKEQASGI